MYGWDFVWGGGLTIYRTQKMQQILELNIDKIKKACERYHVKNLYAFGSAVSGRFTNESDVDFLVEYFKDEEGLPKEPFDYFDLLFSLEEIIGRKVDLVVADAVRNIYFKRVMDNQKILLYEERN